MIILNGHEYVERSARKRDIEFIKEDNCFVSIPNAPALKIIADSMISNNRDVGRLISVCERWIYSTCLCFALEQADQERTSFKYSLSVYQMEFSKNLIFKRGADVDSVFNGVIDRTRSVLDYRTIKTIFGYRNARTIATGMGNGLVSKSSSRNLTMILQCLRCTSIALLLRYIAKASMYCDLKPLFITQAA